MSIKHTMSNRMQTTTNVSQNKKNVEHLRVKARDFNANAVTFKGPKKIKNGNKTRTVTYMYHGNETRYYETPWVMAPFGVTSYQPMDGNNNPNGPKQWSVNLSSKVSDNETDEQKQLVEGFFDQWRGVDQKMVKHAMENYQEIGLKPNKKGQMTEEVAEAYYVECVKVSQNKETGDDYPARIQPKINRRYGEDGPIDNEPNVRIYTYKTDGKIVEEKINTFDDLEKYVPKGSQVRAIIQPKIWYVAGKFGLSFNLIQLLVKERVSNYLDSYAFSVEGTVEDNKESTTEGSTPEPSTPEQPEQVDSDVEGSGEDVEDSGEEEVEYEEVEEEEEVEEVEEVEEDLP